MTDDAQKIIQSVNELGHGNNSNYREPIKNYYQRLTLNQFVDAFKVSRRGYFCLLVYSKHFFLKKGFAV